MKKYKLLLLLLMLICTGNKSIAAEQVEQEISYEITEDRSAQENIVPLSEITPKLIGTSFSEVEKYLSGRDDVEIEYTVIKDLLFKDSAKDGIITKAVLDSPKDESIGEKSKLLLTYHTFDSVAFPFSDSEINQYYCDTVRDSLLFFGYNNVKSQILFDLDLNENLEYKNEIWVEENVVKFSKNDEIAKDTPLVVVGHYKPDCYSVQFKVSYNENYDSDKNIIILLDDIDDISDKANQTYSLPTGTHSVTVRDAEKEDIFSSQDIDISDNLTVTVLISYQEDILSAEISKESVDNSKPDQVTLTKYPSELSYLDYTEVEKYFAELGFSNIESTPIYDVSDLTRPYKRINKITINNKTDFAYMDSLKIDSPISITHHMRIEDNPNRLVMPIGSDELIKLGYAKAKDKLISIGFERIKEEKTMVNDKSEEKINSITITGRTFKKGDIRYKSNVIVLSYNQSYTYDNLKKTMYFVDETTCLTSPVEGSEEKEILAKDTPVKVTGKCTETAYYRVEIDGNIRYVADGTLTDENPADRPKTIDDYTFTQRTCTKYAQQDMNVRDLPDICGKQLGKLAKNDAVEVTGQCNETGWFRFIYNGQTAYGHNDYLKDNKVSVASNAIAGGIAAGAVASEIISNSDELITVYVPRSTSAECYHSRSNCSRMKSPREMSKAEAIRLGYRACSKCY